MGAPCRLGLLGGARLEGPDGAVTSVLAQRHRFALLALLAASKTGQVSRDELLGHLWPESDMAKARHSLSNALYALKKELGPDAVLPVGDDLRLNPSVVAADVTEFRDLLGSQDLERAVALYQGPFLNGFYLGDSPEFDEWLEVRRREYARWFAGALERLAQSEAGSADPLAVVEWWSRAVEHDPSNARIVVQLMGALEAAGDRARALRHAEQYVQLMRDEFEATPDPDVIHLAGELRARPVPGGTLVPRAQAPIREPPATAVTASATVSVVRRDRRRSLVVGVSIVLVIGALAIFARWRGGGTDFDPLARVIAVLPFENFSENPERAYIAAGISEEIATQLGRIEDLTVISRTAVAQFMESNRPLREMRSELGVGSLIEGSVRQWGDSLRIVARLTRIGQNDHLWSREFDRPLTNVFAVQTEVATDIANALDATLSTADQQRITRRPTSSIAAYELYERAKAVRGGNLDAEMQRVGLLRQAIALDSTFAEAMGYLAGRFGWMHTYSGNDRWIDSQENTARRAIALDGTVARAHEGLALSFAFRHRLAEARLAFLAGLDANPGLSVTDLSVIEAHLGRYDESLYWAERDLAANPGGNARYHVSAVLTFLGDHGRTEAFLEAALEKYPRSSRLRMQLAWLGLLQGKPEEMLRMIQSVAEDFPSSMEPRIVLAMAHSFVGTGEGRRLWETLYDEAPDARAVYGRQFRTWLGSLLMDAGEQGGVQLLGEAWDVSHDLYLGGSDSPLIMEELARISAARGQPDEVMRWLDVAYDAGFRNVYLLEVDPAYDLVRGDERFQDLVAKMHDAITEIRRRAFNREGSRFRATPSAR